jgi:hypothetical protein
MLPERPEVGLVISLLRLDCGIDACSGDPAEISIAPLKPCAGASILVRPQPVSKVDLILSNWSRRSIARASKPWPQPGDRGVRRRLP